MKSIRFLLIFLFAVGYIGTIFLIRYGQSQKVLGSRTSYYRQRRYPSPTPKPPTPTPTAKPLTNTPTPVKAGRLSWGEYTGWQVADFQAFETLVGKTPNHIATFVHWGNENQFPAELGNYAKSKGEKIIIFWEAMDYNYVGANDRRFSYDAILKGDWDAYLTSFATQVKNYGNEVILVLFEEMNGDWYPWSGTINGNSAAKHIAAYRYVHNFFSEVANVKFGWDINNDNVPDVAGNRPSDYYPGDAYVDYVGLNGFNFDNPWQSFASVFSTNLSKLESMNKPIYLFSVASAPGTQKADWIKNGLGTVTSLHPKVVGWTWFNENKEKDWRVNSDANSLAAFKSILP